MDTSDFEKLYELAQENPKKAKAQWGKMTAKEKSAFKSDVEQTDAANEGNYKSFLYLISEDKKSTAKNIPEGKVVSTISFSKNKFTTQQAKKWLADNGYVDYSIKDGAYNHVANTGKKIIKGKGIKLGTGVSAIAGDDVTVKKAPQKGTNQLKQTVSEIKSAIKNKKVKELYNEWEEDNNHSANVLLQSIVVNDKTAIKQASDIFSRHSVSGQISSEVQKQRDELSKKLNDRYDKIVFGKKTVKKEVSVDKRIAELQAEIKKQDEDIARYQKNIDEIQDKRAKILFELSEKGVVDTMMPWQKQFTDDETAFVVQALNRYGDQGGATQSNWIEFKFEYVKSVLLKLKDKSEHLSSDGISTRDSVFKKLNIS